MLLLAMGLLFHLLTGGEDRQPGFQGHVIGGMGAITQAMLKSCVDLGVVVRTGTRAASAGGYLKISVEMAGKATEWAPSSSATSRLR